MKVTLKNLNIDFAFYAFIICLLSVTPLIAAQSNITGATASSFGQTVTVLPNGNIVVTAPGYDIPSGATNVGAVYLYDGATLAVISTLTGTTANDSVGSGGITVLTNGDYVVVSSGWDNPSPAVANVGAVTWCSQITGCSGTVSAANSLVGSTALDQIGTGSRSVTALTNGNYVVRSYIWDNGAIVDAGAITWGNGAGGTVGAVSAANSLVGSTAGDQIGYTGYSTIGNVTALTNGNYVFTSPLWDNGAIVDAGAATWGNGTGGTVGAVSSANSLVGSTASDQVGFTNSSVSAITALSNGSYVVTSQNWDNGAIVDAGAATWGNGASGTVGAVSSANSVVGSNANDRVGFANTGLLSAVTALTNGNYVVRSIYWNGNRGAATWGNGVSGTVGAVSATNSLVGSTANDYVGNKGVIALTNGNYVIGSQSWNGSRGAATWGSGATGIVGTISSANSLVGTTASDQVSRDGVTALTNGNYVVGSGVWNGNRGAATWGNGATGIVGAVSTANSLTGAVNDNIAYTGVTALTNGNYVVGSYNWSGGRGAATWGNGATGTIGTVSTANSLVGSAANDLVGLDVTALTNGNYVVSSTNWNGIRGAATWGNGTSGTVGTVSSANSLVGSTANDNYGGFVTPLPNGNYVIACAFWDNGALANAGVVTWGNGATGTSGVASSANSIVGSKASDQVGYAGIVTALPNGNYVFYSQFWDNGATVDAGAYTFGNGNGGTNGAITSATSGGNSVVGTVASGVNTFAFDPTRNRLFVGRSASNTVSILFFNTTATTGGDIATAGNWSNGLPDGLKTGIIPSGVSMTVNSVVNAGQIQVQCGGSLTGGSSSAYIVGSVRKDYCAAAGESFVYPIGDRNNYSPLTAANVTGTGNLTASATDDFLPSGGLLAQSDSLSRYWTLNGSGITANLTFQYVDADVNGTESTYRLFRRNGTAITQYNASTVNTAANTITATGVSQFSDWTAANAALAPTAANVSVGGRILTTDGSGLRNAVVLLTKADGETLTTRTGTFGYYRFDDIEVGQIVVVSVVSKRFTFTPQIVNIMDNLDELNFIAGFAN